MEVNGYQQLCDYQHSSKTKQNINMEVNDYQHLFGNQDSNKWAWGGVYMMEVNGCQELFGNIHLLIFFFFFFFLKKKNITMDGYQQLFGYQHS